MLQRLLFARTRKLQNNDQVRTISQRRCPVYSQPRKLETAYGSFHGRPPLPSRGGFAEQKSLVVISRRPKPGAKASTLVTDDGLILFDHTKINDTT